MSLALAHGVPDLPASKTLLSLKIASTPREELAKRFWLEHDEAYVSDMKRLEAFYRSAAYDFHGIPSSPLCVYKNGDAWYSNYHNWREIREARGVHDHPMRAVWRELGVRVYTLLDDKGVRWTSIDVVAFAAQGKKAFCPLLLWIGVEHGSLSYELANTAAEAASFLLSEAGFNGIEIGFRESVVTRSVMGPKMVHEDYDPIPEFRKPFTPTLGLGMASFWNPNYEGTGAVYVQESPGSERVFVLTCAHVVEPPSATSNLRMGNYRQAATIRRPYVIALGNSGYTNALRWIMDGISDLHRDIEYWKASTKGASEASLQDRREHSLIETAELNITTLDTFHSDIVKHWSLPEQRIIGEVAHVAPIDVAPDGFKRDWALIELYNEKFDWSAFRGNVVFICDGLKMTDFFRHMYHHGDRPEVRYFLDGLVQISGVLQEDEIFNAPNVDDNEEPCHLVLKNGAATGTTYGRLTGFESFTRTYKENGEKETSREIAVLPYSRKDGEFSAPGDSGSIVVDRDGRIVGMITGGAGSRGSRGETDVTYLTPYWLIEQEIRKVFPEACLYEAVDFS